MLVLLEDFTHVAGLVQFDEVVRPGDLHAKIIVQLAHVFHLKVVSKLLLDALHFVQVRPSDENIVNIQRNKIEFVSNSNMFYK